MTNLDELGIRAAVADLPSIKEYRAARDALHPRTRLGWLILVLRRKELARRRERYAYWRSAVQMELASSVMDQAQARMDAQDSG